jgi:hypothetical protein
MTEPRFRQVLIYMAGYRTITISNGLTVAEEVRRAQYAIEDIHYYRFTPQDIGELEEASLDEGPGMLIEELLDESTLEYVRKCKARREKGEQK